MNDNPEKQGRSWTSFLPYIVGAVLIGLIIWWIVSAMSGGSTTVYPNQVDALFGYVEDSNTTSTDETDGLDKGSLAGRNIDDPDGVYFYIPQYNVSEGEKVVNVSFTGFVLNESVASPYATRYSIVVTFEANEWHNDFANHDAYSEIFRAKVEEWKATPELYEKGYITQAEWRNYAIGPIVSDAYQVSFWDSWGPTILWLVIFGGLTIFLIYRMSAISRQGGAGSAMDFNRSPARREKSNVHFNDVAGCDEEKAEMVEMVDYLKEPKKYSQFGARLPKGVLLIGPPGTGKTLLAKAVAGEAGVPFFSISGSDFVEMFVGVGAGRVRDLFRKAKQNAPCVIFIDEIDAVGRQRGAGLGGGNDEREQTLNQLLVEMDGFSYNAGILVMAATNRDDVLDPALLRPGRFDRIITVGLPDKEGREAIFKVHARNKTVDPSVDFKALAQRTVGFSGADIENIMNEAAILAVRFHKSSVGMAEIDEAIDRRIAGPAKNGKGMNALERRQVAYHESGHAIIGLVLPHSEKVQKITIIPRGRTGGHVLMTPEDDRFLLTKKELLAQITGLLGGRSSEEIFFDDISTGAENDIQQATRLARLMVTTYGMSELGPVQYENSSTSVFLGRDYTDTQKNFSAKVAYEIDSAVRQIIEQCHQDARRIISEHREQVNLIANTLLEKETITAEEIDSLVKTGKLPEKKVETPTFVEKVAPSVSDKAEDTPSASAPDPSLTNEEKEEKKE